jgi:multicomponent Na+:H+ antiporter subunit D
MLSGVFIKALGVYALFRVFFSVLGLGQEPWFREALLVLGTLSMIVGSLLALGQEDIKRLLAYSSISQVGYVVFAVGLGPPLGYVAALFHLFNHAVMKALLFLNSGAVEYSTGTRDLRKMGGLKERMPVTAGTSLIAAMSTAGLPPLGGFWSKLLIIWAAVQAGRHGYALLAILISVVTLAYYLRMQRMAFFGTIGKGLENVKESPAGMWVPMVVLALLCVVGGLLFLPEVREVILEPAGEILAGGVETYEDSVQLVSGGFGG